MKRMLINATQAEELRVAIADGQKLIDLDLETPAHEQKKANVYKARITRVEQSLEACFVNYGAERHGFLPFKEINPTALPLADNTNPNSVNVKDVLREGQELIVQVEKEERGTKGAALSTYISLAGRYSVLMPNSPKSGGVSRRISGEERDQIRNIMDQLNIAKDTGLIIRTAGVGRDIEELQWDLDYLQQLWAAIEKAAQEKKAPFLIYQESNLIIRALRDYLRDDISEILIDSDNVYQSALEFMQLVMPYNLRKLKHYKSETPLFTRYQIESQIETAFAREVTLPSGGSLVIDHTEAMLSIDINSARATKGADIEETALQTNQEAADEIARQLRIRDLGGLIVIDFIDMLNRGNQRKVEERLREALSQDRARIQTSRISKFGLLEMSRQRMRPSIGESSYQTCPRCDGHGSVRSVESLALSILRLIEEEAIKDYTGQILAQAPTKVTNFLHNEKREALRTIEQRHNVPILILSNPDMHTPRFEIKRLRKADISDDPSYLQVNKEEGELVASATTKSIAAAEKPAVSGVHPSGPAPHHRPKRTANQGWWRAITAFFSGKDSEDDSKPKRGKRKPKQADGKQSDKPSGKKQRGRKQGPKEGGGKKTAKRGSQRKKAGKKTGAKKAGKKGAQKPASNTGNEAGNEGKKTTPRRRGKRGGRKRRGRQQQNAHNNNQGQGQSQGQGQNQDQGQNKGNNHSGNQNKSNQGGNAGNAQQSGNQANQNKAAQQKPAQDKPQTDANKDHGQAGKDASRQQPRPSGNQPSGNPSGQSSTKPADQNQPKPAQSQPDQSAAQQAKSGQGAQQSSGQDSQRGQAPAAKQDQPAGNNAPAAQDKPAAPKATDNQPKQGPSQQAKPADTGSDNSKSEAASTPSKQPANQPAPPSGPSAKPEAVKGIYSLSDSGKDKPSSDKGGKDSSPPERSGTDG